MSFSTTYKQLLEIQIRHNYFLNSGTDTFESMNDTDKAKHLKLYDFREFMDLIPTQVTHSYMSGHKLVAKAHPSGLSIYCKLKDGTATSPFIPLSDDLELTFVMKTKDSLFGNYTHLDTSGKDIFYFGNSKPTTEGASFKYIPKSNDNTLVSDDFKLSTAGSAAKLATLKSPNNIGVFGLIQLKMIGDSTGLSVLTTQGNLKNQLPVFKVQFANRSSFWRYRNVSDDTEIFTTATQNPLTKFGFIEVTHAGDKYPNPNANHIIPENNDFISEIYI